MTLPSITAADSITQRLRPFEAERVETDGSLRQVEFLPGKLYEIHARIRGAVFPVLIKAQPNSRVVLVFGQSALSNRDKIDLPVFHRWTWMNDFPDTTCIVLSDPTLALDPALLGGWFQGEPDHFYAETAAILVRDIAAKVSVSAERIIFYGSSAGGFTSIVMAGEIGGHAVVEIPQIVMSNYHVDSAVRGLLKHCYGGLTLDEAKRRYGARMDVTTRLSETKRLPNVLYLQNLADTMHLNRHLQPFLATVAQLWEEHPELRGRRFVVETYFGRTANGDGHMVAPKETSLRAIRRAMQEFIKDT